MVDLRFVTIGGAWQHATLPASAVDEDALGNGIAMGTSIVKPDLATARVDSLRAVPTLAILCDVIEPASKSGSPFDPRQIAKRAQEHLRSSGIADMAYFGLETAFFIFDSVAADGNVENEPKGATASPSDPLMDLRSEMVLALERSGIGIERHRRSDAAACRAEVDVRFGSLVDSADGLTALKDTVKHVAARNGKIATFMPKPLAGVPGSALHCHQSLWKDGRPLFFDANGYAECSQTMLYYVGGLLAHVRSILAFAAPATNSYRRLARDGDAPVLVGFSGKNASVAAHLPATFANAKTKRVAFRMADPSANPYLAFSAMLLAGLDGIKNKIDPVRAGFGPLDRPIEELSPEETAKRTAVPASLAESLQALADDHAYLTDSGVFTKPFITRWIALKTEELAGLAPHPHPREFGLYLDC